jgi:hypothetical protein
MSHLPMDADVDNMEARRYFLLHSFPQRAGTMGLKYTF